MTKNLLSFAFQYLVVKAEKLLNLVRENAKVVGAAIVAGIVMTASTALMGIEPAPLNSEVETPEINLKVAELCLPDKIVTVAPDENCAWKQVRLAHEIHAQKSSREEYVEGWFRLRFDSANLGQRDIGIYTVALNQAGRVFLNGHLVKEIGPMTGRLPLNWNRAQYVYLNKEFLNDGGNILVFQVRALSESTGWLGPVVVGDAGRLHARWERRVFWQNDVVLYLGICTCLIGVLMLGVWLGRREDSKYFWFGWNAIVWAVVAADCSFDFTPVGHGLWDEIMNVQPVLRAVVIYMFALRYANQRRPIAERICWGFCIAIAAGVFGHFIRGEVLVFCFLITLIGSVYITWLLVKQGFKEGWPEGIALLVAGSTQLILSGYDLQTYSASVWEEKVYLAQYSVPLFLFVISVILMRQFIDSLNAYQKLVVVMEAQVEEKSKELVANYQALNEAKRNEAIAKERARIMSEMHDGIGSQLTMALSLVKNMKEPGSAEGQGKVAQVLRESIEDLQLIIDSLEPVENDLLTVLGMLRYRLQTSLSKGGIELDWNVIDLPPLPMLTPQAVLSILRILQEAFANCIKHSSASRISVGTSLSTNGAGVEIVRISVRDNGKGMQGTRVGRGLTNMKNRASMINGTLEIEFRGDGTEVILCFPTERTRGKATV